MKKDNLGNRMKEQYEERYRIKLPRRTYTIIRIDGKAFHTYTKNCEKPFDEHLSFAMDKTAIYLCENIQGAKFAYTQSDEISILLTDFEKEGTSAWFDGNLQKIASVSAAMATMKFNKIREFQDNGMDAIFDSRVFIIPDPIEVANYFIWRQQDATRNSISMVAQSHFSHKSLQGKSGSEMQDLLHEKGINWNDYSARFKRGGFTDKEYNQETKDGPERSKWVAVDPPIFPQDQNFLYSRIPTISTEEFTDTL